MEAMSEASTDAGSSERGLAPADLLALSIEPNWAMEDPEQRTFLAVRLDAELELGPSETARLSAWLADQPVPVIGVGGGASSGLDNAVDLIADGPEDLQRLAANIRRWPQASAMLVQVLRATAQLGVVEGLAVESMAYATLQGGAEFARWLAGREPSSSNAGRPEDILLLHRQAERLDVVLNCPENRNALSKGMRDALTDAFRWVVQDPSITRVEISAPRALLQRWRRPDRVRHHDRPRPSAPHPHDPDARPLPRRLPRPLSLSGSRRLHRGWHRTARLRGALDGQARCPIPAAGSGHGPDTRRWRLREHPAPRRPPAYGAHGHTGQ